MTNEEFTQKKIEGLKERQDYYKKEILNDFEKNLEQYFKTDMKKIWLWNNMPFTPKEVVEIIHEKYPDLKIKAKLGWRLYDGFIHHPHRYELAIIPKKKYRILFWEVWI